MVDQRLMRLAAERQATERAEREQKICYIYSRQDPAGVTWFVQTDEDIPVEFAKLEQRVFPTKLVNNQ